MSADFADNDWVRNDAGRIVQAALELWTAAVLNENADGAPDGVRWRFCCDAIGNSDGGIGLNLPRQSVADFIGWMGHRLIWWPGAPLLHRRTSILSSRLSKRRDLETWWFDVLRTSVIRTPSSSDCVCCVAGTAPFAAVSRACQLFGVPQLQINVSDKVVTTSAQLVDWLVDRYECEFFRTKTREVHDGTDVHPVFLSPEFLGVAGRTGVSLQEVDVNAESQSLQGRDDFPPGDRALMNAGERIVALSCRPKGNVERLLLRKLEVPENSRPLVLVSATENGPAIPESLIQGGAIPWLLAASPAEFESSDSVELSDDRSFQPVLIADGPVEVPDEWLCHWTRPVAGPWQDQAEDEFLDELILGCETADRSAFAALIRLMTQQVIKCSVSAKGKPSTVSFTSVPLAEFRSRRIFRRHRQRFDFEPWGVAIRKAALQTVGAETVAYLDDDSPVDAVPPRFTQRRFSSNGQIDWSVEQEWRVEGDVELGWFANADVVLFVDHALAAASLRRDSPWQVLVVPDVVEKAEG
ncbi:MAG: hypothetical protein WAO83_14615 [Fuerstiella sp.]